MRFAPKIREELSDEEQPYSEEEDVDVPCEHIKEDDSANHKVTDD